MAQCSGDARVGVDVAKSLLRGAHERGLSSVRADAHRLPFADGTFDAIVAGNAVIRQLDYGLMLGECSRVLTVGGEMSLHTFSAHAIAITDLIQGRRPSRDPLNLNDIGELTQPAAAVGLRMIRLHVWRATRFPPYVVELPRVLPPALALRLGSHVIAVFRKGA